MLWWALEVLILILATGGLLAGVAVLLPRISALWEAPPEVQLERIAPVHFQGPSKPLGAAPVTARPDQTPEAALDPRIAAAISLALALALEGAPALPAAGPGSAPGSPWTLSGRWQAMAARYNPRKR